LIRPQVIDVYFDTPTGDSRIFDAATGDPGILLQAIHVYNILIKGYVLAHFSLKINLIQQKWYLIYLTVLSVPHIIQRYYLHNIINIELCELENVWEEMVVA
jgi:hypothetical protein